MKRINRYISTIERISSIDDYISEKLHINKDVKVYDNEKVLTLQRASKANYFNLNDYLQKLIQIHKDYPICNRFVFSYDDKSKNTISSVTFDGDNGEVVPDEFDKEYENIHILIQTLSHIDVLDYSIPVIPRLIEYYHQKIDKNIKYFVINSIPFSKQFDYLYLFYSSKYNAIQLYLSSKKYDELKSEGAFD